MHESGVLTCALQRVQTVLAFGIRMVQPRKQDCEAPQIAALLVQYQIVRIVRANTCVAERSHNLRGERETSHEPKTAVWFPGDFIENLSQLGCCKPMVFSVGGFHRRLFWKAKLCGAA